MADTSYGYVGSVDQTGHALLSRFAGAEYAVAGAADWKVTPVSGVDRTVSIAPGVGYGHGVWDEFETAQTVQLPTLASGTRWDLVCMRRTWSGTVGASTTLPAFVSGTSAQSIPAGRNANPGTLDDQPLALVQITAGQQVPTAVIDLRTWTSKMLTASSLLAFGDAPLGTEVRLLSGVRYWRGLNDVGALQWQLDQDAFRLESVGDVSLETVGLVRPITGPISVRLQPGAVRFSVSGDVQAQVGAALVQLQLYRGSTTSGTRVATWRRRVHGAGGAFRETVDFSSVSLTEPTGAQTYRLFGLVESGSPDVVAIKGMTLVVENI